MSPFSSIPFVKATAYGNDFLIVHREFEGDDPAELTRRMCDRNFGIGADGVEWLSSEPGCAGRIHLINSDGSFAELSGNGTRCVAAHLASTGVAGELRIATDAGVKICRPTGNTGVRFDFLTDMGEPVVGETLTVDLGAAKFTGVPVSMGNPHFVLFVAEFPANWQQQSRAIQARTDVFPEGINVEWVVVHGSAEIAIRIYERGAGETHSSGTGSSASASAAIATQRVANRLQVIAPGGTQRVAWTPGQSLQLEGAASLICRGEYLL